MSLCTMVRMALFLPLAIVRARATLHGTEDDR